ncbi:lipopolysaccharide biosynthesis protein [Bdellovibrio bacteriovorus]|uniref:Lipopolysaccharide biosynthesis protein n=1 Tax=Bdellovibrio bacteriovorus TaxID=959 RepID=A0A150WRT1_BDEBC|nr:glycosyltransferase family 9 protein [Bdellovibrio bacteriovorus]KYG67223.1 lipopolysaccharide biosynthesis protein [Bdellovibrio bacteriovorus]
MKILVTQLARLGDIYMTWPVLRAVRRTYPDAEIHLLTRPRFEGAVEGLKIIDRHWSLSSSTILSPLVQAEADIDTSLARLDHFVSELSEQNFDWIINLTFSPVSSYLTHAISGLHTRVSGYSRYNDGTLCLSDEVSGYFYSQVGTNKANRVHLSDIFASMLELEYVESDWAAPEIQECAFALPERYIIIHVGASEAHKSLTPKQWIQVLQTLGQRGQSIPIVLIGAPNESVLSQEIIKGLTGSHVVDLVGKTKVSDLFAILQKADLLVGCDSAPIHMASLTDTPTLNISVGNVNFWETGPKASLGFIYRAETAASLNGPELGAVLADLLDGNITDGLIVRSAGLVSYQKSETASERFQWDLVQALYLGGNYPVADRIEIIQGAYQLQEINTFAMEQIKTVPTKGLELIGPLLDRAEEVIQNISQWVPELSPLISWYQAEKIRIGPGSLEEICTAALNVHERMARHLQPYIPHEATTENGVGDGTL